MIKGLIYRGAKLAESHPYIWFMSWYLIHLIGFLLPHDKSYYALKHFCHVPGPELFLDIGANSGVSALSFRKINKDIPIFSIEPNIIHAKSLQKIRSRLTGFNFLLKGVGDQKTEITFHTPIYKGIILHTFTSSSEIQVFKAVQNSFGPKIAKKIKMIKTQAEIICVDHLNIRPSIIKIDAEGFDYNVLLGARKTIETYRPFLMVEVCQKDLEKYATFFQEQGFVMLSYHYIKDVFSIFTVENLHNSSGERNMFAVPSEKMHLLPVM